jgi:hypothetical protein
MPPTPSRPWPSSIPASLSRAFEQHRDWVPSLTHFFQLEIAEPSYHRNEINYCMARIGGSWETDKEEFKDRQGWRRSGFRTVMKVSTQNERSRHEFMYRILCVRLK